MLKVLYTRNLELGTSGGREFMTSNPPAGRAFCRVEFLGHVEMDSLNVINC